MNATSAFYKQFASIQMHALDVAYSSDVSKQANLANELLSASFIKALDFLEIQAKIELGNILLSKVSFFSPDLHDPITALAARVAGNLSEQTAACNRYSTLSVLAGIDSNSPGSKELLLERLSSPVTLRIASSLFSPESLTSLLSKI